MSDQENQDIEQEQNIQKQQSSESPQKKDVKKKSLYETIFDKNTGKRRITDEKKLQKIVEENYKEFILLMENYTDFYKEFAEIKTMFSNYENDLKFINQIQGHNKFASKRDQSSYSKSAKFKSNEDIESEFSDFSDLNTNQYQLQKRLSDDFSDCDLQDYNENPQISENQKIKEQLEELMDNLNMNTYEHNYQDGIQQIQLLQDMKSSEKYAHFLMEQEFRHKLETFYQNFIETIISDIENEQFQFHELDQLIQFLLTINQAPKSLTAFLNMKMNQLSRTLKQECEQIQQMSPPFSEKISEIFLNFLVDTNKKIEEIYKEQLQSEEYILSQCSTWMIESCDTFYDNISSLLFQYQDLEDTYELMNSIIQKFTEHEKYKVGLSYIIQKKFLPDVEVVLEDTLDFFCERSLQVQEASPNAVFQFFSINSFEFSEDELFDNSRYPINFFEKEKEKPKKTEENKQQFQQFSSNLGIQDFQVSAETDYRYLFNNIDYKASRGCILFWNYIYHTIDIGIAAANLENGKTFACSLIILLEKKVKEKIKYFFSQIKEDFSQQKALAKESHLIALNANLYQIYSFTQKLATLIQSKVNKKQIKFQNNYGNSWKTILQGFFQGMHDSLLSLFTVQLLQQIPALFSDQYAQSYSKKGKGKQSLIAITTPSDLFQNIVQKWEKINNILNKIMVKNDRNFFVQKVNLYILYMIEYVIYWDYHNKGKKQEIFLMEKKDIQKLHMVDMNQINNILQRYCERIPNFTLEGMNQFIFDMHYLAQFYIQQMGGIQSQDPKKPYSNEQFIEKAISCFSNAKKVPKTEFSSKYDMVKENMETFLNQNTQNLEDKLLNYNQKQQNN